MAIFPETDVIMGHAEGVSENVSIIDTEHTQIASIGFSRKSSILIPDYTVGDPVKISE